MIHLRLLRLARPAFPLLLATVVAGLLLAAVGVVQAVATARLFTGIVTGELLAALGAAAAVLIGALLARPVLSLLRELAVHAAAGRVKASLRARLLDAEAAAGPLRTVTARSGERQSLLVDAVENLEAYFGRYLPQVVVTALTGVLLVVVLLLVDPVVGAVVGVIALLVPFLPRLWDAALAGRGEEHWGAYSALHADVVDSVRGMPTLKALGAAPRRRAELARAGDSLLVATLAQLRLSLVESGLTGFFLIAGPAAALLTAAARVEGGQLAPQALFLVTLLSLEVFRPFRELANHWHAGYAGVSAGTRILAVLGADPDAATVAVAGAAPAERTPTQLRDGTAVSARGVAFRYPGADRDALREVTADIPAGSVTAIVGASGSGKTTLATLLLGFAAPDAGELLIGGRSTALLGQTGCSALVSVVSQDPVLFSGSIRHNLRLVAPDADDALLLAALRDAGAEDLLEESRGGLDAPVGDNGGLLSGGQRQRLAIARALLRDTPVLLLDEASSALDARREHAVLARLRASRRSDGSARTVIVIAHRLTALRDADLVLAFDDGRLAESGRYDELVSRGGVLARLHAAQAEEVLA